MGLAIVVGGSGRMGSWFGAFLREHGYQVAICDQNKSMVQSIAVKKGFRFIDDLSRSVGSAQLVVLATPTQVTRRLLEQISSKLHFETLLVEISSIKQPLRRTLKRLSIRGIPILSIHPMFGPGTRTLRGRTVLVTSIPKRNTQARRILSIFRKRGARVVRCGISEHDELMSALLTLPHFLNVAMTNTLKAKGFDPRRLRTLAGTTFNLQLLLAEVVHQESPENEASILMDGSESKAILQEYVRQCRDTVRSIRRGERGRVKRSLELGRSYLKRDKAFSRAYDNFNASAALL